MQTYRYYCLSILDKHHHPDITLAQGLKILNMCADELKRRMPVDFKGMKITAVTKDGMRDIEFDDNRKVVTFWAASGRAGCKWLFQSGSRFYGRQDSV